MPRFRVLIEPAEDIPGLWCAICLDNDVATQGTSVKHAQEMIEEALSLVLEDDVGREGEEPRKPAPKEYWDRYADAQPPALAFELEIE